jgi:phi13 family phage major tail protein
MTVNANQNEYKSFMGFKDLYIAQVTQDSALGYVAGTPELFAPACDASLEPSVATEQQYADDKVFDTVSEEAETVINLVVTGIPAEMLALITGKNFDAGSGRVLDIRGIPPYFALGFRTLKSGGGYRYYWFFKGKFEVGKESFSTRKDKPDLKTTEIKFTAIDTIYEFPLGSSYASSKRIWGDDDTTNFNGNGWFDQVQTLETTTPSALALSSSNPTDGASSIPVDRTITLTFNNALTDGAAASVVLVQNDGTVKECANSLDLARKVLTVDPTTNMLSASTYIIAIGVTDIYGQTLISAVNFTTAS